MHTWCSLWWIIQLYASKFQKQTEIFWCAAYRKLNESQWLGKNDMLHNMNLFWRADQWFLNFQFWSKINYFGPPVNSCNLFSVIKSTQLMAQTVFTVNTVEKQGLDVSQTVVPWKVLTSHKIIKVRQNNYSYILVCKKYSHKSLHSATTCSLRLCHFKQENKHN